MKNITDQLATTGSEVSEDDMIAVTLNGLGKEYKSLDTSISVRAEPPGWDELVALLLHEEVKLDLNRGSSVSQSGRDTVLYSSPSVAEVVEAVVHFEFMVMLRILMVSNNKIHWQDINIQSQQGSNNFRGRGRSSCGRGASWQSSGQSNMDKDCHYCVVYGHR